MTTKVLTGLYTAGYTLSAAYSALSLLHSAGVYGQGGAAGTPRHVAGGDGGVGLEADFAARLDNRGAIAGGVGGDGGHVRWAAGAGGAGGTGVELAAGGYLDNGDHIEGGAGGDGGRNLLRGVGGDGGAGGFGVVLGAHGGLANTGTIFGGYGGYGGGGTARQGAGGAGGSGALLSAGGTVQNSGRIEGGAGGHSGYYQLGGGAGATGGAGLTLQGGAALTNTGRIEGGAGGYGGAYGGTTGVGGAGVVAVGGLVTNGPGGTILGGKGGFGPVGGVGGAGGAGIDLSGRAILRNSGTIEGGAGGLGAPGQPTGPSGDGVRLIGDGTVVNGALGQARELIAGFVGVYAGSAARATVVDFGVIEGTGGTAVEFLSAVDTLVVEGRARFIGAVEGGGGTLDLARGSGRLIQPFAGGAVTVSRSFGTTTFNDFATLAIGRDAVFTTSATLSLAAGESLIDAGVLRVALGGRTAHNAGLIETSGTGARLTLSGALLNSGTLAADGGTLRVRGALSGSGGVSIAGGVLDLAAAAAADIAFAGDSGELRLDDSQGFTGSVSGFARGGGQTFDLTDVGFVSADEAVFTGGQGAGTLTVTDGTHTARIRLVGDYRGARFTASDDGSGGTSVTIGPPPALRRFVDAMAGLGAAQGAPFAGASHTEEAVRRGSLMLALPRPETA